MVPWRFLPTGFHHNTVWHSGWNHPIDSFHVSTNHEIRYTQQKNPEGSALVYSTYLGGSGRDEGHSIAIDALGNAYVTGDTDSTNFPTTLDAFQTARSGPTDAFVTKLNPEGSALVYSTYLGGNVNDAGSGIAVDADGNAYVTGWTNSTNFPTTPDAFQTTYGGGVRDAFIAKISP